MHRRLLASRESGRLSRAKRRPALRLILESLELRLAPAHVAIIGDFGSEGSGELSVANLVKSWNPDFVLTLGDNNYGIGSAETMDANIGQYYHDYIGSYSGIYGAGSATNRFFPVLGNHDWGDFLPSPAGAQPYLSYFTLPGNERYYDFAAGPVHYFAVDSDRNEPDGNLSNSVQATWLKNGLAAATEPWKIVLFHHPPYTSGDLGGSTDMRWPFQAWGATAVLSGHEHLYERLNISGMPYFVDGAGGGGRDTFERPPLPEDVVRYDASYGAMLVDAGADQVRFQFINIDGAVIDTYTINATLPAAPSNLTATPTSKSQINLSWTDNSAIEDGFAIERSTDGSSFTQVATVASSVTSYSDTGLAAATKYYYRVHAYNANGNSSNSNTAADTTAPATAWPAPSNVTATVLADGSVKLTWTDNSIGDSFKIERSTDNFTFTQIDTTLLLTTTYVDKSPAPNRDYYRIRSSGLLGDSGYSNVAVLILPPAAPSNLSAAARSSQKINLNWVDNSTNEDGFTIGQSTDGGKSFTQIAALPANVTSYAIQGLSAATTYSYRVSAYDGGGVASSGVASATTSGGAPAAPSNVTATSVRSSIIHVTWTDNSNNEDGFKVYRSIDGVNFTWVHSSGANTTVFEDTHTSASTTYYYQVTAFNTVGDSGLSNTASVTTMPLPVAPSNLTASAISSSSTKINLTWTDNSADETGFKIYRSTDSVSFNWVSIVGANVTAYTDTGRKPSTTYWYQVVTYRTTDDSLPSNTASATTTALPAAPSNLTASAVSSAKISLSWTDNSTDEDGFKIYRSTDGISFDNVAAVGANVTAYTDTGRSPSTKYWYQVGAYRGVDNSLQSNTASATTPALPAAPSNLTATALSSSQVGLTWTDNSSDEDGFKISRSADGVSFAAVASVGANVTSFTDTGRAALTKYWYQVVATRTTDSSLPSNTASATTLAVGALGLVSSGANDVDSAASGTFGWSARLGAAAIVDVYVANPDGTLTPDEYARIQDAIVALNRTWDGSNGLLLKLVDDPSQANIIVSNAAGSAEGGYAEGLLGVTEISYFDSGQKDNGNPYFQFAGQVVTKIIEGWDWYTGDPRNGPGIAANQYDYQTVVTHELGHAVGLDHDLGTYGALNGDGHSVMYPYLDPGQIRRQLSTVGIAWLDHLYAAGANPSSPASAAAPPASASRALRADPAAIPALAVAVGPSTGAVPAGIAGLPSGISTAVIAGTVQPRPAYFPVPVSPATSGVVSVLPAAVPFGANRGSGGGDNDPVSTGSAQDVELLSEPTPLQDIELLPAPAPAGSSEATAETIAALAAIDSFFADGRSLGDLDVSLSDVGLQVTPAAASTTGPIIASENAGSANPAAGSAAMVLVLGGYWARSAKGGKDEKKRLPIV